MYQGLYGVFIMLCIIIPFVFLPEKPLSMNRIDFIMLHIHKKPVER